MIEFVAGLLAFFIVVLATPPIAHRMMALGIVGLDVNKADRNDVPEECGLAILLAFAITYPLLIGGESGLFFIYTAVLLVGLFGFFDRKYEFGPNVKMAVPILVGTLLIPVVNPQFKFIGDVGAMAMAVAVISFAVVSNLTNMLAGFNGLEVGMGAIASLGLSVYAYLIGSAQAFALSFILFCSLVAFFLYNRYPAQAFPGDSGNMMIGAVLASAAAVSGLWVPLLIVLMPQVIDAALKFYSAGVMTRSKFRPVDFRDGKLHAPSKTYLSVCRVLLLRRPMSEQELVLRVHAFGLLFALVLILIGVLS